MKDPIKNNPINRFIQAIPLFIFLCFTIYFFVNGNVGFHAHTKCKDNFICLDDFFKMMLVASAITIYIIIFVISHFHYSPKYKYVNFICLLLFLFGISDLQCRSSLATVHRNRIEYYEQKLAADMSQSNTKCENLISLGLVTENTDYFHDALVCLDIEINKDPDRYQFYKSKSFVYSKLAELTDDFKLYAVKSLENLLHEAPNKTRIPGNIPIRLGIKFRIEQWAKNTKKSEDILWALPHLRKVDSSHHTFARLYQKLYTLTADSTYLYNAINEYEEISYAQGDIGEIYEELKNYPKALEYYNRFLARDNTYYNKKKLRRFIKRARRLERKLNRTSVKK